MEQRAARSPLSGEEWQRVAALADRLEEAWRADRPVALETLLPPPDDPLRAASLRELVKTDLEIRYRRGLSATLDEYLTQLPELAAGPDDALAELLYEEYRVRQRFGDRPPLESYQARFPRLYDALLRLVQENPVPTQAGPAPTPAVPVGVSVSGDFMESNRLLPIGGGYVLESLLGRGGFGEVCAPAPPAASSSPSRSSAVPPTTRSASARNAPSKSSSSCTTTSSPGRISTIPIKKVFLS